MKAVVSGSNPTPYQEERKEQDGSHSRVDQNAWLFIYETKTLDEASRNVIGHPDKDSFIKLEL